MIRPLALFLVAATSVVAADTPPPAPASYPTAEQAVAAFIDALRAEDDAAWLAIFGADAADLLRSGDPVQDELEHERFLAAYDAKHALRAESGDSFRLVVGEDDWEFPFPIVRSTSGFSFDTRAGAEEIINRRIGRNELSTIQTCLAVVDAQREYYAVDRDGDGLLEYARRFLSTPGTRDGLFWRVEEGEPVSPLGELAADAAAEGYERPREPQPFRGYLYRLLLSQGPNAPGGAYRYAVRDHLLGGFAALAYPAQYGVSGVMTFAVSHDGIVYQKHLGEATAEEAAKITVFDPDASWRPVDAVDLEPLPD